jgi:hypothetical protein
MEAEAQARLAMAVGIKAAGNAAHRAGNLELALAHYRQAIRCELRLSANVTFWHTHVPPLTLIS